MVKMAFGLMHAGNFSLLVVVAVVVVSLVDIADTRHRDCPCRDPALCQTIRDTVRKEIFVFSLQNKSSSWERFDWKKLTTVVTVGYVSTDLMCLAHQHGARVVIIANYKLSELTNATLRTQWVKQQLTAVQDSFYDGINIDFEDPILKNQSDIQAAYTALVKETYDTFKQADSHFQVTVDVAWSPDCIDDRCYDSWGLADNSDFLFIMAYDEQSQIFGSTCAAFANSDYVKTVQGVYGYLNLHIPASRLVLGVPWYGYSYQCLTLIQDMCTIKRVAFRGVNCSDAAGSQMDYSHIYPLLVNHSSGGRQWDKTAMSPFFNFKDAETGQMYQMRYDDPQSLSIKYALAQSLDLRGVGTWNIDCLDFSDAPYAKQQTQQMFDAFPNYPRGT